MATATRQPPKKVPRRPAPTGVAPSPTRPAVREVLEYVQSSPSGSALAVDQENGVVKNVFILGRTSRNGAKYADEGITAAIPLYEGAGVNLNHPEGRVATAERMVQDGFGELRNVNEQADGLHADHHYLKEHPFVPQYLGLVRDFPNQCGFSHNAAVTESVRDGEVIFNSIQRVRSVDLVRNPATTRGVFESEAPRMAYDPTKPEGPGNMKTDCLADDPAAAGAVQPVDNDPAAAPDPLKAAFDDAVLAVIGDDSLDLKGQMSKIKEILAAKEKAMDAINGKPDEPEAVEESEDDMAKDEKDDEKGMESLKAKLTAAEKAGAEKSVLESLQTKIKVQAGRIALGRLKVHEKHAAARSILEAAGLRPTMAEVKAFSVLESEEEQKQILALFAKANATAATGAPSTATAKPRSTAANALESAKGGNGGGGQPTNGQLKPMTTDELKSYGGRLLNMR